MNGEGQPSARKRPDQPTDTESSPPSNTGGGDEATAPDWDATIAGSVEAAAKRAGLGPAADGSVPNGRALLAAMGGARGIVETVLPGLLFLVGYTVTRSLPLTLALSVGVAVVFTIARLAQRTPLTQALAGLIGVGASAALALLTNRPEDNFVIGLYTNAGYGVVLLASVLVGWPLIGLAAGYLMGDGTAWRRQRRKFYAMQVLTLVWVGMFALRLAVQLPLYLASQSDPDYVSWLAGARLAMGLPLYAPLLLLSWLMVRAVFTPAPAASKQPEG